MNTAIYAHRGASRIAPENTMPAFKLAKKIGADGIETDVQLTKDQVPVLIHDESLNRTTDGTGFVYQYTYEELKKLDVGSWFATKYKGTQIVSLEEFLTWIKDTKLKLNLELKNNIVDYSDIEYIVQEQLQHFNMGTRTVISSFNPNSIRRYNDFFPYTETALLLSKRVKDPLARVREVGANGLHTKYSVLTRRLVKDCHKNDLPLRIYTVNRPSRLMRCYKLNCNGIFTDVPHSAIEYQELYKHKYSQT